MEFKELQDVIDKHTFTVYDEETKDVLKNIIRMSNNVEELLANLTFESLHAKYVYNEIARPRAYMSYAINEIFYSIIEVLKKQVTTARGELFVGVLANKMTGETHTSSAIYWANHLATNYETMNEEEIQRDVERVLYYDGQVRGKSLIARISQYIPNVKFE